MRSPVSPVRWLRAVTVILAAFRVTTENPQADPTWVKLLTNGTVAEYGPLFITGMLFYLVREGRVRSPWALASAASTVLGATLLRGVEHGVHVAVVCVVFAVVVLRRRTGVLLLAPVQWFGKISYSLYIMHTVAGFLVIDALWPHLGTTGRSWWPSRWSRPCPGSCGASGSSGSAGRPSAG